MTSAIVFIWVLWSIGGELAIPIGHTTLRIPGFLVVTAFVYAVLLLTPLAAFSILWHVLDALGKAKQRRDRSAPAAPGVLHGARPIEQLRNDLHRLAREIERIEASNPPAKASRLRATTLAYDDVRGDLYAGTDFGPLLLRNGSSLWERAGLAFPEALMVDLEIFPSQRLLIAATHGMGIYYLRLPD